MNGYNLEGAAAVMALVFAGVVALSGSAIIMIALMI